MSWNSEDLWRKAVLFQDRAHESLPDEDLFGLWCSLAIEQLARASIAGISPTLLAEPDDAHKHLLHALGRGAARVSKRSIASSVVGNLCSELLPDFREDEKKLFMALLNRRNEELHTGSSAFSSYPSTMWLSDYYRTCSVLCKTLNRELKDFLGNEEAQKAGQVIAVRAAEVRGAVESRVASHRKVFENKVSQERETLAKAADSKLAKLVYAGHHKVKCPACGCSGSVTGEVFGQGKVTPEDDAIIVRLPVYPSEFYCEACELRLKGYAELEVVSLAGRHTRTIYYEPGEYYRLGEEDVSVEYDNE